jgi:hypothetical protein
VPVSNDVRLPAIGTSTVVKTGCIKPIGLCVYGFKANEILEKKIHF